MIPTLPDDASVLYAKLVARWDFKFVVDEKG